MKTLSALILFGLSATFVHAQRGAADWMTSGGDAHPSWWIRSDPKSRRRSLPNRASISSGRSRSTQIRSSRRRRPVNLDWMMTGPQADFWPSQIYSGQFYSENSPMGIMAFRGQVVEGAGLGAKRLMGTIGDRTELGKLVKANDWNEYTVIARSGTFTHIVNGQLMAVMVDDDPESINNRPGLFGIEIEATTKVPVRNIRLKKLN